MRRNNLFKSLALVAVGGIPLVTSATCDPYGASFFRDDDDGFYYEDPYYYDPYYDSCYYDDCYYEDAIIIEEVYYGP